MAMKSAFVLAVVIVSNIICYAAEAPTQCAGAPSPLSNDEVIFFRITGSTNTPPVCYTVTRTGTVIKETGASRFARRPGEAGASDQQASIPASLAEKIFGDVEAARPFSELPKAHCAKSVSFGTVQRVFFKGENSPDLSCGRGDEKTETLKGDLAQIMSTARFAQAKP